MSYGTASTSTSPTSVALPAPATIAVNPPGGSAKQSTLLRTGRRKIVDLGLGGTGVVLPIIIRGNRQTVGIVQFQRRILQSAAYSSTR